MAGSYADAPSRRMAIDADGCVGLWYTTGAATELSAGEMSGINDEATGKVFGTTTGVLAWVAVVFPELREIDGLFLAYHDAIFTPTWGEVQTSGDTTNGIDGSWVQAIANFNDYFSVTDKYRDNITSLAVATEKGIRSRWEQDGGSTNGVAAYHIYGAISPGETPDRILFLDTLAADAVFTKVLDFGDVPRGQTQTRTFKIKNNSSTYTINTIQVTAEDLYLNAGDWYTFGIDDVTYQATYAAGNLGTGATLPLYMKQIIPDGETLGVQAGRIKVSHASLT